MPQLAKVASVEALEAFRANLIVYISKARPALEEVSADVLRVKMWLENEQRTFLENELRKRNRAMEDAQQALFSARISIMSQESSAEQMIYHRARRARDEVENRLRVLKKWTRDFDNRVQPLVKQTEKLHTVLANDLVKATAYLAEIIKTLSAYAERSGQPSASEGPGPAPGTEGQSASPIESGQK